MRRVAGRARHRDDRAQPEPAGAAGSRRAARRAGRAHRVRHAASAPAGGRWHPDGLLEELNRAERYIQQPWRLQPHGASPPRVRLARAGSASRRYHPRRRVPGHHAGIAPSAPASSRFSVRADCAAWLAWAQVSGRASRRRRARASARAHLFQVSPGGRGPTLPTCSRTPPGRPGERALLRDVLGGYLPPAWVESLTRAGWAQKLPFDVRAARRLHLGIRRSPGRSRVIASAGRPIASTSW